MAWHQLAGANCISQGCSSIGHRWLPDVGRGAKTTYCQVCGCCWLCNAALPYTVNALACSTDLWCGLWMCVLWCSTVHRSKRKLQPAQSRTNRRKLGAALLLL